MLQARNLVTEAVSALDLHNLRRTARVSFRLFLEFVGSLDVCAQSMVTRRQVGIRNKSCARLPE